MDLLLHGLARRKSLVHIRSSQNRDALGVPDECYVLREPTSQWSAVKAIR